MKYNNTSLRTVNLCEETGIKSENGACVVHGGDACLYEYKHPYDNPYDFWKRKAQWIKRPEYG